MSVIVTLEDLQILDLFQISIKHFTTLNPKSDYWYPFFSTIFKCTTTSTLPHIFLNSWLLILNIKVVPFPPRKLLTFFFCLMSLNIKCRNVKVKVSARTIYIFIYISRNLQYMSFSRSSIKWLLKTFTFKLELLY